MDFVLLIVHALRIVAVERANNARWFWFDRVGGQAARKSLIEEKNFILEKLYLQRFLK